MAVSFDSLLLAPVDLMPGLNRDLDRHRFALPAYRRVGDDFLGWCYRTGILLIDRSNDRAAFFRLSDFQRWRSIGEDRRMGMNGTPELWDDAELPSVEVHLPEFLREWLDGLWLRFECGQASIRRKHAVTQSLADDESISKTIRDSAQEGALEGTLKAWLGDTPGELVAAVIGALPKDAGTAPVVEDILIKRHAVRTIVGVHECLTGRSHVRVDTSEWFSGEDFYDDRFCM